MIFLGNVGGSLGSGGAATGPESHVSSSWHLKFECGEITIDRARPKWVWRLGCILME